MPNGKIERPAEVTDAHLEFLDRLRESAKTNMLGAGPYLRDRFPELTRGAAHTVLLYWLNSFSERHPRH